METNQNINSIFKLLQYTYVILPVAAGLDKFTNILTNWEQYIAPSTAKMLPFSATTFMMIVGVIEIVAGILVFVKPAIGGYVVAAWLTLIALSLLTSGIYLDIAVRDLVMAVGALSVARLAKVA
jgi:uncharacterized membrane protein YphA (DoxX/SURF4 family)